MPNSDQIQAGNEIEMKLRGRKWGWIGHHTLRKSLNHDVTRNALDWNLQGNRRIERPSRTRKCQIITELSKLYLQWIEVKHRADDRAHLKQLLAALHSLEE